MTDQELIEGCKKGKHSAFEALYKKYAMKMMAIAQRYCNTSFEGEDILQESFIKVFQKINTFDSKGSFEGWLKRVVVNTAINHYHQNYKLKLQVEFDSCAHEESIPEDAISHLGNQELLSMIRELPEGYRMVFNLYVIEGYNHKEIGELLNISEGTSKSQLSKAKAHLKNSVLEQATIKLKVEEKEPSVKEKITTISKSLVPNKTVLNPGLAI